MANQMILSSGAKTTTHKVSDLQRRYSDLIEEVLSGADVVLTRNGEQLVALVDIDRYIEAQSRAAKADELVRKVEQLQARLDLVMLGGPSLEEARKEAGGLTAVELIASLEASP